MILRCIDVCQCGCALPHLAGWIGVDNIVCSIVKDMQFCKETKLIAVAHERVIRIRRPEETSPLCSGIESIAEVASYDIFTDLQLRRDVAAHELNATVIVCSSWAKNMIRCALAVGAEVEMTES